MPVVVLGSFPCAECNAILTNPTQFRARLEWFQLKLQERYSVLTWNDCIYVKHTPVISLSLHTKVLYPSSLYLPFTKGQLLPEFRRITKKISSFWYMAYIVHFLTT